MSATPAAAATRFAEPLGSGLDPCGQADPCSIQNAADPTKVQDGDEVVLLPGDYSLSATLGIVDAIDIHGQAGQPRPRLLSSASTALHTDGDGFLVRDLEIVHSGTGAALLDGALGTVERVFVHTTAGSSACAPIGPLAATVIRDSVCWNSGTGAGVGGDPVGAGVRGGTLRNVTAVASGSGPDAAGILPKGNGSVQFTLDAKNVIARGTTADVKGNPDATSSAVVTLDHSNYATEASGTTGTTMITNPGTGTNQTASPAFANAGAGNFHQLAGSPTIDAGATVDLLGSTDLDGEPRSQGSAPDIGADEFAEANPGLGSLELSVEAKGKQKAKRLKAELGCGAQACEVSIGGKGKVPKRLAATTAKSKRFKLKPRLVAVAAGETETVRLKFKRHKKAVKKIGKLISRGGKRAGKRSKVKATFVATGAGGADAAKLKIKLKG